MTKVETTVADEAPKATGPAEASVTADAAAFHTNQTDTTAQAEMSDDKTPMKDLTGIQYIGTADVKSLTAQDLGNVGVTNPKGDLKWDSQNDRTVDVKDVNASTLEYLRSQPDFRIF